MSTPDRFNTVACARRGLTLLELMLALAITGMMGAAMSAMVVGVTRGMESITGGRSATQRAHVVHQRLRAYTEAGLCVLQHDKTQGLALWLNDNNGDDDVNLTEYRVFWFDEVARTLSVEWVEFPEEWTDEQKATADIRVLTTEDLFLLMEAQRAFRYTRTVVLGDELDGFAVEHNTASILDASRVTLRARTQAGTGGAVQELLFRLVLTGHTLPASVAGGGDEEEGGLLGGGDDGDDGGLLGGLLR